MPKLKAKIAPAHKGKKAAAAKKTAKAKIPAKKAPLHKGKTVAIAKKTVKAKASAIPKSKPKDKAKASEVTKKKPLAAPSQKVKMVMNLPQSKHQK